MHCKNYRINAACALLSILWAACGADREALQNPLRAPGSSVPSKPPSNDGTEIKRFEGPPCSKDVDCASGFCDRGFCAQIVEAHKYGIECEPEPPYVPPPPLPPGFKEGPPRDVNDCIAYRCMDGRCRSCQIDSECSRGSTCEHTEGFPGRSCGAYALGRSISKEPQTPPAMLPLLGETSDLKPLQPGANQYEAMPPASASTPSPPPPKPSGSANPKPQP